MPEYRMPAWSLTNNMNNDHEGVNQEIPKWSQNTGINAYA